MPCSLVRDRLEDRDVPAVVALQVGVDVQLLEDCLGGGMVGLVHHEDVGDLEDARLDRLHVVARARDVDDDRRVRRVRDLDLVLAGADGLDDHDVDARGVHHGDDVAGRRREAAERAARRHAADEDAGIRGQVLHADAVAEDRAVRERADVGSTATMPTVLAALAVLAGERAGQRALAGAGRPGDADDVRVPAVRVERRERVAAFGVAVLDAA